MRSALEILCAVEKIGTSRESTGVRFGTLSPSIKVGKCSHCGADGLEVRTWKQPGAQQSSICMECAGR